MKNWILAAAFLSSLSASATTFNCNLATTGESALMIELVSAEGGGEVTLINLADQSKLHATVGRGLNPYFVVLEFAPHQSREGKGYLERGLLELGRGELILGSDSYACHR